MWPPKICQPLDKLEFDNHVGAAYGLLNNAYPIFCGGKSGSKHKMKYGIFFNNRSHNSFQLEVRIDKVFYEMARHK